MNIRLLALLFLSLPTYGLGQDYNRINNLKQLLANAREDTSKALIITDLADAYMYSRPDSCIYYGNMGLELIRDESTREKFRNSNNRSLYEFEIGIYRMIATSLAEQRNDALAVKMSLKSLALAETSRDKYDVVRIYTGVAEVYQFVGEPAIAIKYLKKEISLDTSAHSRHSSLVVVGTCFFDLGEYDSALYYLKGIDPFYTVGDNHLWSYPHLYLGKTYAKKRDYQKALGYYRTAINFAILSDYALDLCDAKMGIADLYRNLNLDDSAIFYAKNALQQSRNASLPDRTLVASSFLASMYDARNEKDSAIKFLKQSAVLSDSLHNGEKIKQIQNFTFDEQLRQREIIVQQTAYRNKIRLYVLLGGILALLVVALILYRNNKNKQKLNAILGSQKDEIQSTLTELRSTQSQLVQSEKMASLGEMAAGIAHEIQNPLNFINNFSDLNKELLVEMKEEIKKGNYAEVNGMAASVVENEEKINHHGKRADAIVKGMLQHSKPGAGLVKRTNLNSLADEYLRLAYNGMRAKDDQFVATMKTDFDPGMGEIDIIPQDMGRALINLFNNAFYSINEKRKKMTAAYSPTISLTTKKSGNSVFITVTDNGLGISQNIFDKIFQPFFTTKPTGQGTGLGLSISYDIVKAHGGQIKVETKDGEETKFIIELPSA